MSKLEALKKSKSLQDLAPILGYQPKAVSYILFKLESEKKYTTFEVPKKSGGKRIISKPCDKLKSLQRSLADLLYDCIEEMKPEKQRLEYYRGENKKEHCAERAKKAISHGYEKGLSIASNAAMHTRKKYVYNIDIKSFFPSFNFGRIRGFFLKNKKFRLHPKVATLLAQIACFENELPQGSPCSPVIANLICNSLDISLMRIAKQNGCVYTRYVDDLTFSTNLKKFPVAIASKSILSFKSEDWRLGKKIEKTLNDAGFEINIKKCRMQRSISHQEVTGLTVNKKVNIRNSYYRNVRSMCHSLFKYGYFHQALPKPPPSRENRFQGIYRRIRLFFIPPRSSFTAKPKETLINKIESVEPVLGMLAHIYNIKSYRNKFVRKGYRPDSHDGIRTKANGKISFPTIDRSEKYEDDNHVVANDGVKNLYGKVLFFKYFFFLKKPLIICEGKTDNIYLKCAIESLAATFPDLAKDSEGIQKISFFNKTNTNSDMLKLAEGTPGLEYLISIYKRFMNLFKCEGKKHPVIFIVDNDGAGKGLISKATKIRNENRAAKKIKSIRHKNYFFENLYIVSIPTKNSHGTDVKDIEDLFDAATLAKQLSGKTFYRKNTGLDPHKHYGKSHFAEHIVKAQKKNINYNEFSPLLSEIVDIINSFDHNNLD